MANDRNIIRLECDLADPYRQPVNALTGAAPDLARARAIRWEIGVRDKMTWQQTISQFASLTLEIKLASSRTAAPQISKTLSAASFASCQESEWINYANQHAVINFDAGDTGLAMGGANTLDLWLVLTGVGAGGNMTLAAGTCQMTEDGGVASGNTPTPGSPDYLTREQTIAAIAAKQQILEFTQNGYTCRFGIDTNGQLTTDIRPA